MTVTIPELVRSAAESLTLDFRSTTASLVAILTLVLLLIAREIARARGGRHRTERLDTLGVAVWPLLLVFSVTVVIRMVELL